MLHASIICCSCRVVQSHGVPGLVAAMLLCLSPGPGLAADRIELFDGSDLKQFEFADKAWLIAPDNSMTCGFKLIEQGAAKVRRRSLGYAWTKQNYEDFRLRLQYRLSSGANSGVFFRTNPNDPVQQGFEIQLLEEVGYKQTGKLKTKNRNAALYDCQAARLHRQKPVGEWNHLMLECIGPQIRVTINGVLVNRIDISKWDTPRTNPDGTQNKFRAALSQLPRSGRIGLQNHGDPVWFRNISIEAL